VEREKTYLRFNENKRLRAVSERKLSKSKSDKQDKFLPVVSLATEFGFSISLPIVGGAVLGQFLDNKLNLAPKMTLSLIFLGLFIGIANIYLIIKEYSQNQNQ